MNKINIDSVKVIDRLRETDEQAVNELVESIKEIGLINPITIDSNNQLLAGAHRLEAYKRLVKAGNLEYQEIPCINIEDGKSLTESDKIIMEIAENVNRSDMSWQSQVIGIYKVHTIQRRESSWTQAMTAKLFNVSQAYVSSATRLGKMLDNDKEHSSPLWNIPTIVDAIQFLVREKKDAALARMKTFASRNKQATPPKSEGGKVNVSADKSELQPTTSQPRVSASSFEPLFRVGDCIELMKSSNEKFDHIITDPPYGIDMDNIYNQDSIQSVKDEHQVDDNLRLIKEFIFTSRKVIKESGFLCMFYDIAHHEKIQRWTDEAGYIPCRWAFVWCKSSPCSNGAAAQNITKATELCGLFRASPKAVLAKKRAVNWLVCPASRAWSHPFAKPFGVWKWLAETVSFEGQSVLDPFAGGGSCVLAMEKLGRNPTGFELKEEHVILGCKDMATNYYGEAYKKEMGGGD